VHVDTVKQGAGDLSPVAFYLVDIAVTAPGRITEVTAGAPLRCLFAI
jgi:hypothetical protein